MSRVIGPNNKLPGNKHSVAQGTKCDNHPDVLAVIGIQGETDSMGAEIDELCQECVDSINIGILVATCDWCGNTNVEVESHRDIEEGESGRVYEVCKKCIHEEYDRISNEYN